ncbi:hypothetical protein EYF80_004362 [Liparis tanakae]|uniref:Uncharacterized protein n=1 Tax=Liparis tanakae TaxID=230148 RepID=A0A4Z2J593_9TELE|nr:hypothetical protein EYF80_004362 [Liparis tanakae]
MEVFVTSHRSARGAAAHSVRERDVNAVPPWGASASGRTARRDTGHFSSYRDNKEGSSRKLDSVLTLLVPEMSHYCFLAVMSSFG